MKENIRAYAAHIEENRIIIKVLVHEPRMLMDIHMNTKDGKTWLDSGDLRKAIEKGYIDTIYRNSLSAYVFDSYSEAITLIKKIIRKGEEHDGNKPLSDVCL